MYFCYTDGATSNNLKGKGVGGYGWIILNEKYQIIKEGNVHVNNTTNNECELKGLIDACNELLTILGEVDMVIVYSDSAYCVNCYEQKWWKKWLHNGWVNSKKEPVSNKELWQQLIPFFEDTRFVFRKVAGHSNNKWNNYVDQLAVKAKLFEE